jgi:hypothetical protein
MYTMNRTGDVFGSSILIMKTSLLPIQRSSDKKNHLLDNLGKLRIFIDIWKLWGLQGCFMDNFTKWAWHLRTGDVYLSNSYNSVASKIFRNWILKHLVFVFVFMLCMLYVHLLWCDSRLVCSSFFVTRFGKNLLNVLI